jgi:hypothetical protein
MLTISFCSNVNAGKHIVRIDGKVSFRDSPTGKFEKLERTKGGIYLSESSFSESILSIRHRS